MDEFEKYGVTDPEELKLAKSFIAASDLSKVGYDKLKTLPEGALHEIIQRRYRNSAASLVLCQGNPVDIGVSQKLLTDMNIITFLSDEGVDLYRMEFNTNLILGTVVATDIFGLMDAYKHALELGRVNPSFYRYEKDLQQVEELIDEETGKPYRAYDLVGEVKDILLENKNNLVRKRSLK